MVDPLDEIRLKRERAWSQLDGLKIEITAFVDSDPYIPRVKLYRQSEQLAIWGGGRYPARNRSSMERENRRDHSQSPVLSRLPCP